MTPHTFEARTLIDSGNAPIVHLTIAITPGSTAEVTVSSALAAAAHGSEESLVSDADEFTSVPSTAVPANGTGNGHTTLVG